MHEISYRSSFYNGLKFHWKSFSEIEIRKGSIGTSKEVLEGETELTGQA
jgi:hypothetical protein